MEREGVDERRTPDLLLHEGTRLVHIGPHKTGTTALQAAFHLARDAAKAHGLDYPGNSRHPAQPVLAVLGRPSPWSDDRKPPDIRRWNQLAREVRGSRAKRVLVSSEHFSDAEPETIARIVQDLGGDQVHVAVTLRPIARILPSQWQQWVQNRLTKPFDSWLHEVLGGPPGAGSPAFWGRHRHDTLIADWAAVVKPRNVTAIVLDERDPDFVLRVFERLLGLPTETLAFDPVIVNRSLTLPEVEVVRAFNEIYQAEQMPIALYTRVMRRGTAQLLGRRTPDPGEPRVELPDWALEPVAGIAREIVDGIAASGVRVVGDLESLAHVPESRSEAPPEPTVTPQLAASVAFGILVASGAARGTKEPADDPEAGPAIVMPPHMPEPPELFRVSTQRLGVLFMRRLSTSIRARVSRALRRT